MGTRKKIIPPTQCYIVTKANPQRFRIPALIHKYHWTPTYLCDTQEQRKSLIDLGIPPSSIHVLGQSPSNPVTGAALARDYLCRHLMPKDQWSIWIDDNVERITGLKPEQSNGNLPMFSESVPTNWRKAFQHELTPSELNHYLVETITRAEQTGTIFCGFATETNHFFRRVKWRDLGYCRTQFALYKNDGSSWYPFRDCMIEDLYKSIDVVTRYGQIVINRHLKPVKPMFEEGGIGSFQTRLPWLKHNCRTLADLYPGLLRLAGEGKQYGDDQAYDFHVQFMYRSLNKVKAWRQQHGYLME